jgi:hypothetical protein
MKLKNLMSSPFFIIGMSVLILVILSGIIVVLVTGWPFFDERDDIDYCKDNLNFQIEGTDDIFFTDPINITMVLNNEGNRDVKIPQYDLSNIYFNVEIKTSDYTKYSYYTSWNLISLLDGEIEYPEENENISVTSSDSSSNENDEKPKDDLQKNEKLKKVIDLGQIRVYKNDSDPSYNWWTKIYNFNDFIDSKYSFPSDHILCTIQGFYIIDEELSIESNKLNITINWKPRYDVIFTKYFESQEEEQLIDSALQLNHESCLRVDRFSLVDETEKPNFIDEDVISRYSDEIRSLKNTDIDYHAVLDLRVRSVESHFISFRNESNRIAVYINYYDSVFDRYHLEVDYYFGYGFNVNSPDQHTYIDNTIFTDEQSVDLSGCYFVDMEMKFDIIYEEKGSPIQVNTAYVRQHLIFNSDFELLANLSILDSWYTNFIPFMVPE